MAPICFAVIGWGYWGPKIARNLDTVPGCSVSLVEAEELISLAAQFQHTLMVGQTFLYSPAVNELRKLIQAGELGKIYCVEAERLSLGLYRSDINVIWDLAPHDISILLYLFGDKEVEHMNVQAHTHLRTGVHDIAHLDLTYIDGMTAHIHVSWLHPHKIRRVTVIGDAKMVVYDDTNPAEMIKIYNEGADVDIDPVVSYRFGAITIPHIDWIEPLHLECEDLPMQFAPGKSPAQMGNSAWKLYAYWQRPRRYCKLRRRRRSLLVPCPN